MALRLRGATSGYIELKAPASAGDNTLTLPVNNGSANQILKTDGNGNLSWVDDANTQLTFANDSNNRVITGTGSGLNAEANLTFDGTTLKVSGASNTTQAVFSGTGGSGARGLEIVTESVGAADEGVIFNARASGTTGRLKFNTNSVTAMTILGNGGNVGIGTVSPDSILHVHNGSAGSIAASSAANLTIEASASDYNVLQFLSPATAAQQIRFGDPSDNGAGWFQYSHSNNAMTFGTAGPEKMRINSTGQLLLGSTANYGTIGTAAAFQIQGTNTGSNVSMNIVNAATSNASSTCDINAWQDYRLSTRIISGRENANNWTSAANQAASFLAFYTNSAGTVAEKFGITSNGSLQHSGGGTWASAKTTGDFAITVSGLTANAGNTWRKCGVFVMYSGINADATNSKSGVGYYGVGSVTNWNWFATGEDEEFTADSLTVTLDNDTTTSFRLNFNVADNNTGSVNVFVNGDSAKPIVSIAA